MQATKVSKKIVIVGAGFGGTSLARSLRKLTNCEIVLIDRRNFHLFQPLLYQVAMAGLNPSDIAIPLRHLFQKQKNISIVMAKVDKLDLVNCKIHYDNSWITFDYLVLACGSKHFYFNHNEWEDFAPGLKTLEQAIEIRRRILNAIELAEKEIDPIQQAILLTYVVVGAGPTGVELAGAIAEMTLKTITKDYKKADLSKTKIILIEGGPRVLPSFPEVLSIKATQMLENLGVTILTNTFASKLSFNGLQAGDQYLQSKTIIWAAGVMASNLSKEITSNLDKPFILDKQGRVPVQDDLSLIGFKNIFIIGDQAAVKDTSGGYLPGVAPVAIQQGKFLGKLISDEIIYGRARFRFKYKDKGMMATIGRASAVVSMSGKVNYHGLLAWFTWVFIHVIYLMRFRNKFFVFLNWSWSYFKFGLTARIINSRSWKFYAIDKNNDS